MIFAALGSAWPRIVSRQSRIPSGIPNALRSLTASASTAPERMVTRFITIAIVAAAVSAGHSAWGAVAGQKLFVTLQLPERATLEQTQQFAEAQISRAASFGVDSVAMLLSRVNGETVALIERLSAAAVRADVKLWIGLQLPNVNALKIARTLGVLRIQGIALFSAPPNGEPPDPGSREALLAIKQQGDKLGETIRQVKRQLGSQKQLALCAMFSEIAPETARSHYLPVRDLVRDGTVDVVAIGGVERLNFDRLRLLRDAPLQAGSFLDAGSSEEGRRAGILTHGVVEAAKNNTCQLLWLHDFPIETVGQVVHAAIQGHRQSQERRAATEAALAKGEMVVDQEVSEKGATDLASLHGVAQSFVPSRDGLLPLVQIYAAIRGSRGPLPPPVHVEIRCDDGGKPGTDVLAKADIPAAEFGMEPAYRWGGAAFDPPVPLKQGQTYWIYLTNKSHPDGNYVWRMAKDASGPRGHAWSQRYDYAKHTWVFRVYLSALER